MRLRNRTPILLLLAVAVLGTAYLFWPNRGKLPPAPLTEHEPQRVQAFMVEYADDRPDIELERQPDGSWHIIEPIHHPARETRIARVLSLLNDRTDSCHQADTDRLAQHGLDTPSISLRIEGTQVDFGDRAADGRRYVRSGERLCVVDDSAYPTLDGGLDRIALLNLLPLGAEPVRIETPAATATHEDEDGRWSFSEGEGAGLRWAARWRSAETGRFVLELPDTENGLGEVRVTLDSGEERAWRIVQLPDGDRGLILAPSGQDYGLEIESGKADGLIEPPAAVEDGLD